MYYIPSSTLVCKNVVFQSIYFLFYSALFHSYPLASTLFSLIIFFQIHFSSLIINLMHLVVFNFCLIYGPLLVTFDLWSRLPLFYFNDVTLGVGQSTWLEILLSTGLISLLGYFSFLWVMVSSAFYSAEYRGFAVFAILFVLLVGMSVHYLDKIPRLMLTFSIIFGVLTSYLKSRSTMIHP